MKNIIKQAMSKITDENRQRVKEQPEALDLAGVGGSYFRPKTRGELADKIKECVPCEVVTMNRQFTCICLDGWLKMEGKYKVRLSENEGWDVYEKA